MIGPTAGQGGADRPKKRDESCGVNALVVDFFHLRETVESLARLRLIQFVRTYRKRVLHNSELHILIQQKLHSPFYLIVTILGQRVRQRTDGLDKCLVQHFFARHFRFFFFSNLTSRASRPYYGDIPNSTTWISGERIKKLAKFHPSICSAILSPARRSTSSTSSRHFPTFPSASDVVFASFLMAASIGRTSLARLNSRSCIPIFSA